MKSTTFIAGSVVAVMLTASLASAQQSSAMDQKFFEQHLGDLVTIKPTRLTNPAIGQVLSGDLFKVDVTVDQGTSTLVAAREGTALVQLTKPSSTEAMPSFATIIKPGFKLTSDEAAHRLQDVLDVLYPMDSDDAAAKTISHTGTTWTFIRGKFFDHLKGFVVMTDAAGTITAVTYSLDLTGK